jgi:ABC-type amino acid transport substrate-binding protein
MKRLHEVRISLYLHYLVLTACLAAIAGAGMPAQARSLEEIRQTKELRLCATAPDKPTFTVEPADCREGCTFGGYAYELANALAETLGGEVKLKARNVEFSQLFFNKEGVVVREASYTPELLASGTCDFYATSLSKVPWRLKKVDFVTLFPDRMIVLVHQSKHGEFKTPADLGGKVAAIPKDTAQQTWLQEQNTSAYAANPVQMTLAGFEESLKTLDEGRVDFVLGDSDVLWNARQHFKNTVAAFPVGSVTERGWAFRKDDQDLQAAVQAFFDAQTAAPDSILNKNWKNYFGMTLPEFTAQMTK